MRYPEGHKESVRARIVQEAATALRRDGIAGVSIPALMRAAGLTHGGFYAHFESRDDLVAQAIEAAGDGTAAAVFSDGATLADVLDRYLSRGHAAAPEHGCVVAALGSDGARGSARVRGAFATVARGLLGLVERKVHPLKRGSAPSEEALRLASTMVGAVVLARLVDDERLAARILRAARASIE